MNKIGLPGKKFLFFVIYAFSIGKCFPYPTFNDQILLSDFGLVTNQNISLQPTSQYLLENPMIDFMRTNNYQTLQLKFGEYASGRFPCRIGLFNISESANALGNIPFGTQISLPAYVFAGDASRGIEPNRFLLQNRDPSFWVFSFTETLAEITTDFTDSMTLQVADVWYQHDIDIKYMKNLNVPLSGYHDIQYEEVTPKIVLGKGRIKKIELDGVGLVLPTTGTIGALVPSTKFKFVIKNEPEDPISEQTWLFYAQSDIAKTPITFVMNYEIDPDGFLYNVTLTASTAYIGYIRVAAIQTRESHAIPNFIRPKTTPDWELATQIQSMPATPISMFMLWPYDWTTKVGPQIVFNQETNVFLSSYSTSSLLLPLLARSQYKIANEWYNQLIDRQNKGQDVFDIGTNSFVTLVNMLIANYYDSDIQNFQSSIARGVSTPHLSIQPSASTMEQMFDDHRSEIILADDITFNSDGSYEFDVSTLDSIMTFPQGAAVLPLFSFLGYQTIADGFNIVNNATNKDPIKGDVNYVQGNISTFPGSYLLKFKDQSVPSWAPRFLPDDFWSRLKGEDKTNLLCQLNQFLAKPLPGYTDEVYDQGKILFQLAMTAKYATYVLLAQQKILPPYASKIGVPSSIKSRIQPVIDRIEDLLNTWLITRTFEGNNVSNYFAGDELGKGVVAVKGTSSSTGGILDSGNAVYTGHNRQYGYFLGAAAIAIELDRLFGNPSWLASSKQNAVGSTATIKQFVDMLWRDYANPSLDDLDDMPFYRYGNSWEGLSSSKGMPPVGAFPSRNNESISEDFNGYYATYLYSVVIQNAKASEVSLLDQEGFDGLQSFSLGNLNMIMRSGRALFYNNGDWVYNNTPFNFNLTTGTQWDNTVDSGVAFLKGTPPSFFSEEGALYSKYKFNLFCIDLVNQFNSYCEPKDEGCSCQK